MAQNIKLTGLEDYTEGLKPKYAVIGNLGKYAYAQKSLAENWREIDTTANIIDFDSKKHELKDWKRKEGKTKQTKA